MRDLSRRNILTATTVAGAAVAVGAAANAATFGNPDRPPEGAVNVVKPGTLTDPGPNNQVIQRQFPSFQDPPATELHAHVINPQRISVSCRHQCSFVVDLPVVTASSRALTSASIQDW